MDVQDSAGSKRGLFEFGTLLTALTLSMYVLGYLKLAALYAAIDCTWVLKFNSPQDFISQGAVGVSSVVASAVIFGSGKNSVDAIRNSQVVISFAGLIVLTVAIFLSKFFATASLIFDPLMEVLPYFYFGPMFYALVLSFSKKDFKKDRSYYFLGIPLLLIILIYLQTSSKVKEITRGLGATQMVSKVSGADKAILIGSVNNKYLVLPCSGSTRFSIIDPGADWVVTPIASAQDCKEPVQATVNQKLFMSWCRLAGVSSTPALVPASPSLCWRKHSATVEACSGHPW